MDDRRRLRDLTTISEISLQLSSELALEALFDLIVFYGTVLLEAQRSTLLLIEGATGSMVAKACYGFPDGDEVVGRSADGTIALQLATWQGSRFVLVSPAERKMYPFLAPDSADAAILVPIPGKSGTIGALAVEGKVSGDGFGEYDGETLSLLVAQAGIALENAEVYRNLDELVKVRTRDLEEERDRSDKLLLNILPQEVAEELKAHGRVNPKRYDCVTVMFTDFVGFTAWAENTEPEVLVEQLGACYQRFDEIVEAHGLEKLKTIGDAYMCAGGVPTPLEDHAAVCVDAALEMLDCLAELRAKSEAAGRRLWDARIGIHTGPVVAGVIGKRKFAFDIWGDAVNVASRLESAAPPNGVNISESTWERVRDRFDCHSRGPVDVKGHDALRMFLVRGRRAIASARGGG